MTAAPDAPPPGPIAEAQPPIDYPPGPILRYRRRRPARIGVSITSLGLICGLLAGLAVTLGWGFATTARLEITTTGADGATSTYLTTWQENQTPVRVAGTLDHVPVSVHPLGQLVQVSVSGSGSVTCELKINGRVRKSTSAVGSAACSIRLFPWTA